MTKIEKDVREVLSQTLCKTKPMIRTLREMQAKEKHYQRKYYIGETTRLRSQIDSIVKTGFDKIADMIEQSDEEISKEFVVAIIRIAIGTYKKHSQTDKLGESNLS